MHFTYNLKIKLMDPFTPIFVFPTYTCISYNITSYVDCVKPEYVKNNSKHSEAFMAPGSVLNAVARLSPSSQQTTM